MEKEIKITPPEGFEIDKENSTFECIRFKPVQKKRWRDNTDVQFRGYYIDHDIVRCCGPQWNIPNAYDVFATQRQARSALAMARIGQIMANDERFGGVVTDEEWRNVNMKKYTITRENGCIAKNYYHIHYHFLAFRNAALRDLFLEENEDLVRDYLMID